MNFDQIIEALGLEKLATPSSRGGSGATGGGGAATEPGQQPQQPQQPGPPEGPDDEVAEAVVEPDDDGGGSLSFDWSDDEPVEEADDAEASGSFEEIRHEIDQVAADVDSNASQIRSIGSQQEELLDRLDSIEEQNSQLLGVYDRLTAGINPFGENWQARYDRAREDAENADNRYNVIEPPSGTELDPVAPEEQADAPTTESGADDEADGIGFDDLRDRQESEPEPEPEPEVEETPEPAVAPRATPQTEADPDAYLGTLAPGYATEVLLMEWLTMLIDIAGTSGTLKALDYYENIGWISPPVKHQIEDVLGGANVRGDTPARTPGDLSTEEHNRSFAYIMKLEQQHTTPTAHAD